MVGLGVSPAEAESVGGGDVRRGEEAAAVLPGSAEGPVPGPGLAGLRSSAVGLECCGGSVFRASF